LGFKHKITLLADRGFDSPEFLLFLEMLKIKFVIRVSSAKWIYFKNGKKRKTGKNIIKKGFQQKYENIKYTGNKKFRCNLYVKWKDDQKEPWMLLSNKNVKIEKVCDLYAKRWAIEEMFKSLKNEDVGFDLKKVRLRHFDRWLRLLFVSTIYFQAIGLLGYQLRQVDNIEKPYTMCSKAPKKQDFIFSIFNIAIYVILDRMIKLRYSVLSGFQIKWDKTSWVKL
jgi:transposase